MTTNQTIDGVPSKCRACGSTSLSWFAQNTVPNGIQQNRLNTHDVQCVFVLGCDHCSETLKIISADKIADHFNKPVAQPQCVSSDVIAFGIQVEKLLCKALGREWSASGISIESLVSELRGKPQSEPVAWQYRVSAGPQTGWSLWHDGKGEEFKQSYQVETRPLYAEQPAPVAAPINYGALDPVQRLAVCRGEQVAVVLPNRDRITLSAPLKIPVGYVLDGNCEYELQIWRACIDEVTRLNTK